MNWNKIGLIRTGVYSIIFGLLLIPFHQTIMQNICGGIILGIFGALLVYDK